MSHTKLQNNVFIPHNAPPGFDPINGIYKGYGKYSHTIGHPITSTTTGLCLGGGFSGKAYLKKGNLNGTNITYISKMWSAWNPETLDTFYDELYPYLHRQHLKPLMGICIPTIIGIYNTSAGRISIAMEPPHHVGWREADPHISIELKESILDAFRKVHAQGVLHNDVELRHILIGDDDKITIIDFGIASCKVQQAEFALEMRKVKFMLDYKGSKDLEYDRLRRAEARHARNVELARLRRLAKTTKELKEIAPDEFPSEEEIEYPPFALLNLMNWDSEVETAGKPSGPGWRGQRFEIPPNLQSEPYVGCKFEPLPLETYREVNFGECVRKALKGERFVCHDLWMNSSRYLTWFWTPPSTEEKQAKTSLGNQVSPLVVPSDEPSVSVLPSPTTSSAVSLDVVPASPSGRKRSREADEDNNEGPLRKKLGTDTRVSTLDASACQSDTDSSVTASDTTGELSASPSLEVAKALMAKRNGVEADVEPASGSSQSEAEVVKMTTPPALPRRRSSSSVALHCSVILIDKDEKETVWPVTHQMVEDIQGYLRVKAVDSPFTTVSKARKGQEDEHDASGSDGDTSNRKSRPKRKSTDDGVVQERPVVKKQKPSKPGDSIFSIKPGCRP